MCKNYWIAKLFPVVALSFFISGFSGAGQRTIASELISKLEEMQSKHDWEARTRTGAPKLLLLMHQARVRGVLDQLKSGSAVDPKDIDSLYKEHYRGLPGRMD